MATLFLLALSVVSAALDVLPSPEHPATDHITSLDVWPSPKRVVAGNINTRVNLAPSFEFTYANSGISGEDGKTPRTLSEAFTRYAGITFSRRAAVPELALTKLVVSVDITSEAAPQLSTNESYTLSIPQASSTATLHAASIYGALRGLETFSQLVRFNTSSSSYSIVGVPLTIDDEPRFPHRGFMVDTSRHWQSIAMLKRLIDSMSFAKLNVLHWHAVDDQSFPLQVDAFPELQAKGAFSSEERYTRLDMEDLVEYARLRGIRIVLEIDTPSHTACWCRGYPDVCPPKPCADGVTRTPLDISKNATFSMVHTVLSELAPLFPDDMLHVGQDEVDVGCWSSAQNPTIGAWQKDMGFTTPDDAYVYAANRIERGVRELGKRAVQWWPGLCLGVSTGNRSCGKTAAGSFCPCRGVVPGLGSSETVPTPGAGLDPDTVLQLWATGTDWNSSIPEIVAAGYSAILSLGWYLEDVHLTATWQSFYAIDPMAGVSDPAQQARVLGGEAAMWGEWIDGSQLLNTAWPRTAAVAERLWSPQTVSDISTAQPRLARFRCLLLERGIPSGVLDFSKASPYGIAKAGQPPAGPGSCLAQ